MALKGKTIDEQIWNYLYDNIGNACGAAGLMGNLQSESGLIPNRVEILCLKRLKEHGMIYNDETYTAAVDSGKIDRETFIHPLHAGQYGYGLCQWTSPGRKGHLYDNCKFKGVSIADLETQLEFLMHELSTVYQSVLYTLKTASSVKAASDAVLKKFERPADTGSAVQATRAKYGQVFYDRFAEGGKMKYDSVIDPMIEIAKAEIGYLEKKSNSQLDDKTANAGSANYTKYWRDVYPQFQGQAWCACFVSWVFEKAYGLETAKKLLKHWPYTYCPTLASKFTRNANPKKGDIVIFYHGGTFTHTGIVTSVNGDNFTTIEGNTSGGSTIISNGGGVCAKSYKNSSLPGTKFCTPDYSIVTTVAKSATTEQVKPESKETKSGSKLNESVKYNATVTTTLNVRKYAGTSYGLCSFSPLAKGATVGVCDSVKATDGTTWYYIQYQGKYGFVSGKYLKKVEAAKAEKKTETVGDKVADKAHKIADIMIKEGFVYNNSGNKMIFADARAAKKRVSNCALFASHVLQQTKYLDKGQTFYFNTAGKAVSRKGAWDKLAKTCNIIMFRDGRAASRIKLQRGDIVGYMGQHTNIFDGYDEKGRMTWIDAGRSGTKEVKVDSPFTKKMYKTSNMDGFTVVCVIRPK